jgi:hypothetical protein
LRTAGGTGTGSAAGSLPLLGGHRCERTLIGREAVCEREEHGRLHLSHVIDAVKRGQVRRDIGEVT